MSSRTSLLALAALALAACNSARKLEPTSAAATGCTRCHGDPARPDGSPPRDLRQDDRTTSISVGAHASHLEGSHGIARPVPCEACHAVPSSNASPGHLDGAVQVVFGAVSRPGGAAASWSRVSATCSVYCHGATLAGGEDTAPVWTRVDGSQLSCASCHGAPPPRPHPQRSDCRACHAETVDEHGRIDVAGGRHLDGVVQRSLAGCTDCHGDAARPGDALGRAAPPANAVGETALSARGVGAHAAHLVAGNVSGPIPCGECHAVPAALEHADGAADVAFGPRATQGGALAPAWSPGDATCASTYCHGGALGGGDATRPTWTRVDATQRRCDSCHGAPPPAPHPASSLCSTCHPGTVLESGLVDLANGLHVNGTVETHRTHAEGWGAPAAHGPAANRELARCRDCHGGDLTGGAVGVSCDTCHDPSWRSSCTFCHGDPNRAGAELARAAPPAGVEGETSPADRAVGAHRAHLEGGRVRAALACEECHPVPSDLAHVTGAVDVAFGALARTGGAAPSWAGGRCSATWCHGAALGAGGTLVEPAWIGGASQADCGTCHGAPPPPPHAQLAACQLCHAATAPSPEAVDVEGGQHVDGLVQATPLHPEGWSDPAVHGRAATRDLASCEACHGDALDGGPALVSCASCHGEGWKEDCSFCHGAPPPAPVHPAVTAERAGCAVCHGETVAPSGAVIPPAAGGRHLDGAVQVSGHGGGWMDRSAPDFHAVSANAGLASCAVCHGSDLAGGSMGQGCGRCHTPADPAAFATTCTACHGDAASGTGAPPRATFGSTAAQAIGAHTSHVAATHGLSAPVDCAACHVKPADALADGHVSGAAGVTGYTGTDPALLAAVQDPGYVRSGATASCATSYCHGATLLGGSNRQPVWTTVNGTQAACGTCHGRPPFSGPVIGSVSAHRFHVDVKGRECDVCHVGYTRTSVAPGTHVNGVREVRILRPVCVPQGCAADPEATDCTCTQELRTVTTGWSCGGCH
jgi:predicted CxxxxCH...CXXCH cytochrome family protein